MHLRFTKDMSHKKALQEIHAKVLREFYANTKIKPTIVQKRLCLWCGALVVGIMTHAEYKKCQECLKIFIDCEDCLNHTAPYIPSLPAKCLKCHGCETFNIHKTKAICRPRVLKLSKHVGDIDLGDSIINH
ncbi:hypothetical protein ROZALSC1DRAFT_21804 [Rozella allomycis CSF55]|nr:hypothetical protein ROZALSC1DRAFT_21804 [Rozella allomycis CSF55]